MAFVANLVCFTSHLPPANQFLFCFNQPQIQSFAVNISRKRDIQKTISHRRCTADLPNVDVKEVNLNTTDADDETKEGISTIRSNLQSIGDGKLSISAYDTAWVALLEDNQASGTPLFPSCLEWIVNNQLPDGSWGERHLFNAYDRLSCTLACVVALKRWNVNPEGRPYGISFLLRNLSTLQDENPEHLLSGFEVTFTSMIELAQTLELEGIKDSDILQDLYKKRQLKLRRIPAEVLHNVPTTLLHSLEGIPELDWKKLLKLQHPNGSFLCSPSSTAYAFMNTADQNCLNYLKNVVEKFNGGVPHSYPMDLFERLWVVDRLERLGVSRYFNSEIKECLDYVSGFWTPNGISWSRDTIELDIDDTSMGFRILRLHGYDVDANAFLHFEDEGQFFCFVGQTSQGITEMLSLLRASEVLFPGEKVLEEAKIFASSLLKEKHDLGDFSDRWIITKNLAGEVRCYLDVPWYANLPRIETRNYVDIYGGDDDVWIAKVLYRMYNVSNNQFLEFAKLDYNQCQRLHQIEWTALQKWYKEFNLEKFGVTKDTLLRVYFLAMSSIFEPEQASARLGWAQTQIMIEAISGYFNSISIKEKNAFIHSFRGNANEYHNRGISDKNTKNQLVGAVIKTLGDISVKIQNIFEAHVYSNLKHCWNTWLLGHSSEDDKCLVPNNAAELIVHTINLCAAHISSISLIYEPEYVHLACLTNDICNSLHNIIRVKRDAEETSINLQMESIDKKMQELLQLVVKGDKRMDKKIKLTFLIVAKSYYYNVYCSPTSIGRDIARVLFEKLV